ncbi:MAG TPA: peptidoglycan DD-metalloendopeptidase family protein [Candidatus Pelethenecus sp.]|nr:peptidoglycan DD-metalloendopeptidase family protein [Candidatus Pelethenecus sp.]
MARRPVNSPYTITTEFGVPDSYAKFGKHSGVDYAVPLNRPVYAPTSGQLTNVVSPTGGNMVVIQDNQGFIHRLMHNNSFSRTNGRVNEGEEVAKAGTTGLSTGVHSHWDINREGTYPTSFNSFINPADWLAGKYNAPSAGGDEVIPDQDNYYWRYNKAMQNIRGRQMTREEFRKNFVGRSHLTMLEAMLDNPEADKATDYQQWALTNRASIEKRVIDLQNMVADLDKKLKASSENVAALTKANEELNTKVKNLESQLAVQSEDTQLLNGFGEFLRKMIQRLGLK